MIAPETELERIESNIQRENEQMPDDTEVDNIPEIEHATIHLEPFVTVPENFDLEDKVTEEKIKIILEKYPEIKKIGRIVTFHFKDILKMEIDCSFDRNLSIEKVHDLTSNIERTIRSNFKNAIITIHPEPA